MHLLVLLLFTVGSWGWGNIEVTVDQKGGYNIIVGNRVWLRSSRAAIYVDNKWYSSDDGSLPLISVDLTSGFDPNLDDYRDFESKVVEHLKDILKNKTIN